VANPADVRAGQVLAGRYRLGEVLGRGGCATVYAAKDTQLDRDVAVKVWHEAAGALVESRMTAQLRHPGVVVVHDVATDGDLSFLVMELVAGVSLDRELGFGPLSEHRTRDVVGQLARTLSLVHADGIVHGDVKPGNVLLGPHDHVTLTDFGVASPTRTRHPDVALGTPQYLSPEQVRGRRITPATDVYALGLVLLECLTATRAFPGSAETAAVARLTRGPVVPASVPRDLAALVQDMTALEPVRRPTAAQVAARLGGATPRADTAVLSVGPPTQPTSTEVRPRWALVGAALLAVVLGLGLTGPHGSAHSGGSPGPTPPPISSPSPVVTHTPTPRTVPVVNAPAPAKGRGHHKHHGREG
jgi:serine/threonine protein kinase